MTKAIKGFVDTSQGSLDLTRVDAAVGTFGNRDGNKRTKEARSCFHEHGGEAHPKLGEPIAVTFLDSRYETMSAKFTQASCPKIRTSPGPSPTGAFLIDASPL